MFCVIQEVPRKRLDKCGHPKELLSRWEHHNGMKRYSYKFSEECFERPVRKAYKISVHQSRREGGKVLKEQHTVVTIGYYDFPDYCNEWSFEDAVLQRIADNLNVSYDAVSDLIYDKVTPLAKQIEAELAKTEEYKVRDSHEKLIMYYVSTKRSFTAKYGCSEDMYDYIYDVFGTLKNQTLLEQIIAKYETRRHSQNHSNTQSQRERDETTKKTMLTEFLRRLHSDGGLDDTETQYVESLWQDMIRSGWKVSLEYLYSDKLYVDKLRKVLKRVYRILAKSYHSDITGGDDEKMKFINELKTSWSI
jgi:predicted DNA-binding protein YlxM (UPF0122 family)